MQSDRHTLVTPPLTTKLKLSKVCHAGSAFLVIGFVHLLIYMPQENVQTEYRLNVEGDDDDPYLAADSLKFVGFLFYQLAVITIVFTYLWKSKPCQILTVVFSKAAVVFLILSIVVHEASFAAEAREMGSESKIALNYKFGVFVMSVIYGMVGMIMYWVAICRSMCGCCQCTPSTPSPSPSQVVYCNGQTFVTTQPAPVHNPNNYNNQSTLGQVNFHYQPGQSNYHNSVNTHVQQPNVASQASHQGPQAHVQAQPAGQSEQTPSYRHFEQEEKEASTLTISGSGPPPSQVASHIQPLDHGHHEVCSSYQY